MKMLTLILSLLVLGFGAQAQQPGASAQSPAPAPAQQTAPPAARQQKKEIKDPAEYNAYLNALNQTTAAMKAAALEAFLRTYPNSVMKPDALELLMTTYEQANEPQKMTEAAHRLLQTDPNNLRALALLAFTSRSAADGATNPQVGRQNLAQAAQYGEQGLRALQTAVAPEGMNPADFEKLKSQAAVIFNGAVGMAALQNKNYPVAQQRLLAAVQGNPKNLRDVYPLALSYLQAQPPEYPNGLWYIACAANLAAGTPAQAQIAAFGRAQYRKYHGSDEGWNELLQQASASPNPPPGFAIAPAPTPAEVAARLVQTKPTAQMSFDEIQLVLAYGKPEEAAKVWNDLKDKPIALEGKLISSTPTQMQVAASVDDIEQNKADVTVTMAAAVPTQLRPKNGAMVQFQAVPASYTANPFNVTMTKGVLLTRKPVVQKKAPARKSSQRR
ncbi:MAG: tetratricopeptide repeat protein [Terriglobales bacterium]